MSILERIAELRDGMRERSNVSKKNKLVNSFIYGIDDHHLVSPENRFVHANLGEKRSQEEKSEKSISQ